MSDASRQMVVGSMVAAGLVAAAAISDLIFGFPFSGTEHTRIMDIVFLICAGIVGYLAWDAYKDLR